MFNLIKLFFQYVKLQLIITCLKTVIALHNYWQYNETEVASDRWLGIFIIYLIICALLFIKSKLKAS